jgi:hypothetical protein
MKGLAEQGELGGVLVRLMMVLQDFSMANYSMGEWKKRRKWKKRVDRNLGAAMYFIRLQVSHIFEGLKIIEEIRETPSLMNFVDGCDRETKKAFAALDQLKDHPDYKLMLRIRNNVGFHYDPEVVLQALQRIQRMRECQKKKSGKGKKKRESSDLVEATIAKNVKDTFFHPGLTVENNAVVHGIFKVDENASDKAILGATDEIVWRLHQKAIKLAEFAARFISQLAPAR